MQTLTNAALCGVFFNINLLAVAARQYLCVHSGMRQSAHGITDCFVGIASGRFGGCDCGRRRPDSGPRIVCHLSNGCTRHFVGHQQKCLCLGYSLLHLTVQPKSTDAMACLAACGHGRRHRLFEWRLGCATDRSFHLSQGLAFFTAAFAGLHLSQKRNGAPAYPSF